MLIKVQFKLLTEKTTADSSAPVYLFFLLQGIPVPFLHILEKGEYKVISIVPDKTMSSHKKAVKRLEIALNPYALEIIESCQGKQIKSLPMLTNQKMNEALKEIGEQVGIHYKVETVVYEQGEPKSVFVPKYQLITMHTARHTFATQSLLKGMPIELLQKILGHSDLKKTMIYANSLFDCQLRRKMVIHLPEYFQDRLDR